MSSSLEQAMPIHAPAEPSQEHAAPQSHRRLPGSTIRSAVLLATALVLTMAGMALAYSLVRILES